MRCPSCQFISADTWDICPKCFSDLRPHKKFAGLVVAEPNATYEELAARAGAPSTALKRPQVSAQSSSFFSALFGKSADPSAAPAAREPASESRPDQSIPISASTIVAAVLDASRKEAEKLERVAKEPPLNLIPSDEPPTCVPPIIEFSAPPELPIVEPPPAAPIEGPPLLEPPAVAPRLEKSLAADTPPEPPIITATTTPPLYEPDDVKGVDLLFNETHAEMMLIDTDSTIELTSESLKDEDSDKLTVALFNFAYEVVQNPERENQLAQKITTSDERRVEAQDLSKELAVAEKRMSLPVFGLKSIQARVASARQQEIAEPVVELQLAKPLQQFASMLIDLAAIAALSIVGAALLFMVTDEPLFDRLVDFSNLRKADAVAFFSLAAALAMVLLVLYPLSCLSLFRKTLGHYLCHLRVVTELGRRIRTAHMLVRSLTLPISCLCFGYVLVLLKGRSLHDALARTKVCRDAKP